MKREHDLRVSQPKCGQRVKVGNRECKLLQWCTTNAVVIYIDSDSGQQPFVIPQGSVDLTYNWWELTPAEEIRISQELGLLNGAKQLVWEMARTRALMRQIEKNQRPRLMQPEIELEAAAATGDA